MEGPERLAMAKAATRQRQQVSELKRCQHTGGTGLPKDDREGEAGLRGPRGLLDFDWYSPAYVSR